MYAIGARYPPILLRRPLSEAECCLVTATDHPDYVRVAQWVAQATVLGWALLVRSTHSWSDVTAVLVLKRPTWVAVRWCSSAWTSWAGAGRDSHSPQPMSPLIEAHLLDQAWPPIPSPSAWLAPPLLFSLPPQLLSADVPSPRPNAFLPLASPQGPQLAPHA